MKKKKIKKHKKSKNINRRLKKKARLNNARRPRSHSIEDTVVTVENPAGRQIQLDWDDLNLIAIGLSELVEVDPNDTFAGFITLTMYKMSFMDLKKKHNGWLITILERSPEDWQCLNEFILQYKKLVNLLLKFRTHSGHLAR